jgi:hypothetical protein
MPDIQKRHRVVARSADGCAGVQQPTAQVRHDLDVHASNTVLTGEQIVAGGAFTGGSDEPVDQHRLLLLGLRSHTRGVRGSRRVQQRPDSPEDPRDRRLRAAEQLTGHVPRIVMVQQKQGQYHRPVQAQHPAPHTRALPTAQQREYPGV